MSTIYVNPTPAPADAWPFRDHKTCAEVWRLTRQEIEATRRPVPVDQAAA